MLSQNVAFFDAYTTSELLNDFRIKRIYFGDTKVDRKLVSMDGLTFDSPNYTQDIWFS